MSKSLIPKMESMLSPRAKTIIDTVARENPGEMTGVWTMASLLGDIPSQFYIAKNHLSTMPASLHVYLQKLVAVTELMESDNPPPTADIQGMLFDLVVGNRLTEPAYQGLPIEVVEVLVCAEAGFPVDTKRIDVNDWIAEHSGGVVPVDNETAAAAKAGGLNIDALSVPGNETKH